MVRLTDLETCRRSTQQLLGTVAAAGLAAAEGPSRLPGWSRAHVLTHLARNADSHLRLLEGAMAGEIRDQYPHGAAGRAADIEDGSRRPAAEVIDDLRRACASLELAYDGMTADGWAGLVRAFGRDPRPASMLPASRRREVEVHHVDLALGYAPSDWPTDFVLYELSRLMPAVAGRLPAGVAVDLTLTDAPDRWAAGSGETRCLSGPGFDVLAWVMGRQQTIGGHAAPELGAWA